MYYIQFQINRGEIAIATLNYLDLCASDENVNWGDGDSLDRERVRDFIFQESLMKSLIFDNPS